MNRADRRQLEQDLGMTEAQAQQYASEANEWMSLGMLIQPGPNRSLIRVVDAMVDGKVEKAVRIAVATPNGAFVFHMPAPIAASFADNVAQAAKQAASPLEVVGNA